MQRSFPFHGRSFDLKKHGVLLGGLFSSISLYNVLPEVIIPNYARLVKCYREERSDEAIPSPRDCFAVARNDRACNGFQIPLRNLGLFVKKVICEHMDVLGDILLCRKIQKISRV